ncbi:TRAP transporter small permease [Tropicimonas sp. IMCC6043]|uniref:TRAP transporter small permease n=1 Tax=Tropicimonas sp. IMCC6043 TaxID=2510645 RepID=UPI00101B7635|nr:TRAP transporter small permease subunit [Tropicimonas sp. IMCC6043]RYH10176.1 TRAP transporter small permease subunit [Tropicimonas sp. IMCC6043]
MAAFFHILRRGAEAVAALFMAAMFLTFVLQITVRYSARLAWLPERFPFFEPSLYGWTLEFCLALWLWLIFWGNAFVVRRDDHVTFDIVYNRASPRMRTWFVIVGGLIIAVALLASVGPTWDKFAILRLKRTATLSSLFGDWVRMRHIYIVYFLFLIAGALRFAWAAWAAYRNGAPEPRDHVIGRIDE